MDNPDTQATLGTKHKAETNKTQRPSLKWCTTRSIL